MVKITLGERSGNMDPRQSQLQVALRGSDKTTALGVPGSARENYDNGPLHLYPKPISRRARKRESSWAPGGSSLMANLEINGTRTTGNMPSRSDSTPLPSSSAQKSTSLNSTLNPCAVAFFPSSLNPKPQPKSNLETGILGNPVPTGCLSEKGAVAATRNQLLHDAAYAATLYLEELEVLDPLLEETYCAGLLLEEAGIAYSDDKNEIMGSRKKVEYTRQLLKLQEDAFGAFEPGAVTDKEEGSSHATYPLAISSPPHSQQYEETVQQLGALPLLPQSLSEEKAGILPKPDSSNLHRSVLSPSQNTSTNDSPLGEATVMSTADLSPPEAVTEIQAAVRNAKEAVNTTEKRLHQFEQDLEKFDAGACSGSQPLAPQLRRLLTEYRRTKMCSLDLAIKISNNSRRFHEIMIPNCFDNLIPLSERKDAMKDYINEARTFAPASEDITAQWTNIRDKFLKLVNSFSTWELLEENAKLGDLGQLKQTMMDQQAQLESSTRNSENMKRMLTGAALTVVAATSIGLWRFTEDFVKLLQEGTTHVQTLGEPSKICIKAVQEVIQQPQKIRESLQEVQADIDQKERQVKSLQVQRNQLKELGSRETINLVEAIALCLKIWTRTRNDAVDLMEYLESGERSVSRPAFLRGELDEALRVYTLMASYLLQYSDTIG
ncbi:hypothetical protein BGX38DRAFT_1207577 [Terfezia claveryi]|nr:hypothetical protein BGX38DRAFT_1207577 [Terfezia claveryi]